ncbi:MAG: DUF4296 domain-containing protein [Flavobacteriaceae bacterium]|nr:DUF4296 domain-containing protein [Flavobacteriaceae bacterium]
MRFLVYLFLVIFWVGCQDVKRPEQPENLIPKDTMVAILVESYTGNAARSINNKVLMDQVVALDSLIYTKYAIDSLQFAQSNAYYASQLNEYIDILKVVEERLVVQKAEIDTLIIREAKAVKDSIDALKEPQKKKKDSITGIQIPPVQN